MSQLLDALKRASRPASASSGPRSTGGPRPEDVFAGMGLARAAHQRRRRVLTLAACGLLVIVCCWLTARWFAGRAVPGPPGTSLPSRTSSTQASPGRLPPAAPPAGTVAADPPVQQRQEPAEKPIEGPARQKASAASQPRPRLPLALESFQAAVEYHLAGEFDKALDAYRDLLARGELTAQVHNNLGLLYQSRGRLGEAARELERSISADPRYPKAYNNSGVVLLAQGQIENAVRQFRTAASLDPRDPDPIVNLALAQKAAGQPERARESLLRALVLAPDGAPAHYNLAVLYDESGESARAAEHYKAFLASAGAEYQDRAADVRARLEAVEKILQ